SEPVHETQGCVSQESIPKVVFNQECMRYTLSLSQDDERIDSVMKDIDQHDCIKARVRIWDVKSIELSHWNSGSRPDKDFNSLNGNIRSMLRHKEIKDAIPTAYVQYAGTNRNQGSNVLRKDPDSALSHEALM